MSGRYFDELAEGEFFVHTPSRTITETDNLLFCALSMNPQPLHLDAEFAATTEHGRPIVNGAFTLALTLGLSVHNLSLGTTLGNLGFGEIRYLKPVFVGDTITSESEVRSCRPSRSRPGAGIVEFNHQARNQHGDVVLTCIQSSLLMARPTGPSTA
jgi:acyl dehydratase